MSEQDFVPFSTGIGANVLSQAAYLALPALGTGFVAGIADPQPVNKALRQGTFVASAIATFMVAQLAIDILDDGNVTEFANNFTNAVQAAASTTLVFASNAEALAGALTTKVISPATLAYVLQQDSLIPGHTLMGNAGAGTLPEAPLSVAQVLTLLGINTPTNTQFVGSSTTVVVGAGITRVKARAKGGGGAGASGSASVSGAGGGAGGEGIVTFTVAPGDNIVIVIGAKGTGAAGGNNPGGNGGDTTITHGATTYTARGGQGGQNNGSIAPGGNGGTASNFDLNLTGSNGGDGDTTGTLIFGGHGAPGWNGNGAGRAGNGGGPGTTANAPGAGGGGAYGGSVAGGGDGFAGLVELSF